MCLCGRDGRLLQQEVWGRRPGLCPLAGLLAQGEAAPFSFQGDGGTDGHRL